MPATSIPDASSMWKRHSPANLAPFQRSAVPKPRLAYQSPAEMQRREAFGSADRYERLSQDISLARRDMFASSAKGKQREIDPVDDHLPPLAGSSPAELAASRFQPPVEAFDQLDARAFIDFQAGPAPSASPSSNPSPSSSSSKDKGLDLAHNIPIMLLIVIGGVVLVATLSVSLAWLCRGGCLQRLKAQKRLNKGAWSPGATASTFKDTDSAKGEKLEDQKVSLPNTLPVLLQDQPAKRNFNPLSYDAGMICTELKGNPNLTATPASNSRGWKLHDPPMVSGSANSNDLSAAPIQPGQIFNSGDTNNDDLERGDQWPLPARRPSLIERAVQSRGASTLHHSAFMSAMSIAHSNASSGKTSRVTHQGEVFTKGPYPTVRPLPSFGAETPCLQDPSSTRETQISRFQGSMLSMIPATLRNAASVSRNLGIGNKHMRSPRPFLDSDFEGTIGGKDRELPMAKRIGKKDERFPVDCSTGEEPSPTFGRQARMEDTPGMAGLGAAWSYPKRHTVVDVEDPHARYVARADVQGRLVHLGHTTLLEQEMRQMAAYNWTALALPAPKGDNRQRLLNSVSKWQELSFDAEPVFDPYTSPAHSVMDLIARKSASRKASMRSMLSTAAASEITSISGASSIADLAAYYEGKGVVGQQPLQAQKDLSRIPSINPQFTATTALSSWLDPAGVSTGRVIAEEGEWEDLDGSDPFSSDIDVLKKRPSASSLNSSESEGQPSRPPSYRTRSDVTNRKSSKTHRPASPGKQRKKSSSKVHSSPRKASVRSRSSATQSTTTSAVTSIFDKDVKPKRKLSRSRSKGVAKSKAHAEAAIVEARRRRTMSSVKTKSVANLSEGNNGLVPPTGAKLMRASSVENESVYSNFTAPDEYRALLLQVSKKSSEDSLVVAKGSSKNSLELRHATKESLAPRHPAKRIVSAYERPPVETRQKMRTVSQPIRKRRGDTVRNLADYDDEDSPWSSSDSDVSFRRWGGQTSVKARRR